MAQTDYNNSKRDKRKVSLVGEQVPSSTYDEVFLDCTDGYCVFDSEQKLQAFSSDFPNLYPALVEHIAIGMSYAEYMRLFYENKAVRNMGRIGSAEEWVEQALKVFDQKSARHTHHLHDGRWMQINMSRASTDHWLFIAMDTTELHESRSALEESHDRFSTFAHIAMQWFWELDEQLNYVFHSSHQESLTGYSQEDLFGMGRIESIDRSVIKNEAWRIHNESLLAHEPFDVVLEWDSGSRYGRHVRVVGVPKVDKEGHFQGYRGFGRDVTEEMQLKYRLNHLAEHDDLTGLVNRRAFEAALTDCLRLTIQKEYIATLCFIDLDQFKLVNDGGGHEAGDKLLKEVAQSFCDLLGEKTLVARLGGDEFGVILRCDVNEALVEINNLIRHVSSTPFSWMQRKYTIGASAGLVSIDENSRDISELMSRADTACYMAKNAGRNQAQTYMYDEYFEDPVSLELKQVNLLRDAMDNNGLMLYLQPIKPLQYEHAHSHFEVLLRLRGEEGEVKSAGEFISVAEKYDLMQHLDRWVLKQSLSLLKGMHENNLDVSFSINLSGNTLSNKDSLLVYQQVIEMSGVHPGLLVFEITETAAIKNVTIAKKFVDDMKRYGCGFSLDDFGSGLSSFGYLKELAVDYLKIDGNFVKNMSTDVTCRAIVSAFNQLSHELGMKTVAEFVEDGITEQLLKELGIDFAQGYGIGAPQHADEWVKFLEASRNQIDKAG